MLVALIGATLFLFWPGFAPNTSAPPVLHLQHSTSYGADIGQGNVVGIEPYMEPLDYTSPERFKAKLRGYLEAAKTEGWLGTNTLVLFPEHLGTWLIATNQKSRVYSASSSSSAMLPIVMWNLPDYLKNLFIFDDPENSTAALIRTRSKATANAVMQVYGSLAKEYSVTIVAGSQALMTPGVYPDGLSYGHGPIFNSSFVFGPDGRPQIDAIRKVHPIPTEAGFSKASKADFLPTFKLGERSFGVLICADSWFDDTTRAVTSGGASLLLVPAFLEGTSWDAPWNGYLSDTPAQEGWQKDVGNITEGEAWTKYALPYRASKQGIRWGMTVFLKGEFWGLKGHGKALILENGTTHIGDNDHTGAAIYNLWLGD